MELLDWSYGRKYQIKAWFSSHPNSTVVLRSFAKFYFIYMVDWSESDPPIRTKDLEEMERMMNDELGCLNEYETRKSAQSRE